MNLKGKTQKKKKWPLYCFYAAVALVLIAGVLYFIFCQRINSEFGSQKKYFEETFDEMYSLSIIDSDIAEPIIDMGKKALQTIGTGDEFGLLSRYCIKPAFYPDAVRVEAEIEGIAGKAEGSSGYIWIAYYQRAYNANNELVTGSGSEDRRILARWSLGLVDGTWTVTEIDEGA